jgi:hypothetical protein
MSFKEIEAKWLPCATLLADSLIACLFSFRIKLLSLPGSL